MKWAGGKRSLIQTIFAYVPQDILLRLRSGESQYFEPFVGGGALLFALEAKRATVSDRNPDLMQVYQTLRDNVEAVIACLDPVNTREHFMQVRERFNQRQSSPEQFAADFLYLNKAGFNGLYRVNSKGEFNVPFGKYRSLAFDETHLRDCARMLSRVTLLDVDFSELYAEAGDFVYLDPPYHGAFSAYTAHGFTERDQRRLAEYCQQLTERHVYWMQSNWDTDFIREVYADHPRVLPWVQHTIGGRGASRSVRPEVLIFPKGAQVEQNSGGRANRTGSRLEQQVAACLDDFGYERVHYSKGNLPGSVDHKAYACQVYLDADIYGRQRRVDFMVFHPRLYPEGLVLQCKWQAVSGSVEEKYPFEVLNLEEGPYPAWIILDGDGYSKGAKEWLQKQVQPGHRLEAVLSLGEFQRKLSQGMR